MHEKKLKLRKRLDRLLNVIMASFFGVCVGHALYVYWEYRTYPGLYALRSAPWYASILTNGLYTAVVLLAAMLLKRFIKTKLKEH